MSGDEEKRVIVIGGGPAGLTAAYQLCKASVFAIVLEKDAVVGGLSRTVEQDGYRFDIGGHRFFTKVAAVDEMWREVLPGGDFLHRKRLSRIYYDAKFFPYPLHALTTLRNLGARRSLLILFSYFKAQLSPQRPERTFEQWVTNRFGRRLYDTFFKSYTEKVWGIPCREITAEWAAQRIKGLSLAAALKDALTSGKRRSGSNGSGEIIKTLIDAFDYPRLGPGQMWERVRDLVREWGGEVRTGAGVECVSWANGSVKGVKINVTDGGGTIREEIVRGTHFISSMPLRELVTKLDPAPPAEVLGAADKLRYRDFLTVALVIDKPDLFPDNWIYIHDPEVHVGRIQNFKNWSADMVPDAAKTCLGLEYFCFEGDGLWTMRDEDLIDLAKRELAQTGLAQAADVESGTVVRMPKAYPVYDPNYEAALETVRAFLGGITNLQCVGRNGMHKYNNQDHSMLTAMLAVENILGAEHDLWAVNADDEYHEELSRAADRTARDLARLASTQPRVPKRVRLADG